MTRPSGELLCPDDRHALVPEAEGVFCCHACRGKAFVGAAFARIHPGIRELLKPEEDVHSGAFARNRPCPSCRRTMMPLRMAKLQAWLDCCERCEILWSERLDEPVMNALAQRVARERAVASMTPEQRQEVARDMAAELVGQQHEIETLEALKYWLWFMLFG